MRYIETVRTHGLRTAIVSSSANTQQVLRSIDAEHLFDVRVDGVVATERGLPGKPHPDTFLAAARDLGVEPGEAVVFEDALAGMDAKPLRTLRIRRRSRPCRTGRCPVRTRGGHRRQGPDGAGGLGVITQRSYTVEPWAVRETHLDLDVLAQSESVFALSNGHVGWRGNLDEGDPHGLPGSYLGGVHEVHPLPYAEAGYGYPESGQTVINVTNGKVLRLLVDDEPFDLRYGRLVSHERVLDLRRGVLERTCEWTSPAGSTVRVRSTRLVSLTQRAIAAVVYEVEAVDSRCRVVIQSELVANESLPEPNGDPRAAQALESPLQAESDAAVGHRLRLVHRTKRSGLRVAVAADHDVTGPARTTTTSESTGDVARLTITSVLEPGERLGVQKLIAHGWSAVRSR